MYLVPFSRYWCIKLETSLFSPPYPCLMPLLRGNPSEFLDETYPAKTRGMELLYGENCMILTSTVFDWSTRVTDRQMDGRNYDSICALSIYMLSHAKIKLYKVSSTQQKFHLMTRWFQDTTRPKWWSINNVRYCCIDTSNVRPRP